MENDPDEEEMYGVNKDDKRECQWMIFRGQLKRCG